MRSKYIFINLIFISLILTIVAASTYIGNKDGNNGNGNGKFLNDSKNRANTDYNTSKVALNGSSGTLTILAFDNYGNQLNYDSFKSYDYDSLLVSTMDDNYVIGRPWLKNINNLPIIEWKNATDPIKISLIWELPTTGYSTIYLDNEGYGYSSSQVINFNFEALKTQWKIFNEFYSQRINSKLAYIPSKQFLELYNQSKLLLEQANSSQTESQKAVYSVQGLDKMEIAWELMLREYGIQYGKKYYNQNDQNQKDQNINIFGITIDDLTDYKQKMDTAKALGNDYVRIVFQQEKNDFTFNNENTFSIYDSAIDYANSIGLKVMGEILDSELWPADITVDEYKQRAHNLANHYKGKIFIWEVANEINGNWIGGEDNPISDDLIVDCVNTAAEDIKTIDNNLKTEATLYWGEGTFKDDSHPLFIWINKWKNNKNFGNNIDIIGLSMYPNYDPVGMSFDIIINRLHDEYPDKKIMIGEFGYLNDSDSQPYWWHSKDIIEIQKYLIEQYYISMMGYNYSIDGGFWWNFADINDNGELYNTYKNTTNIFKKS